MDEDQDSMMPHPAMMAELLGQAMTKPGPTQWDYKQAALNWTVHWAHDNGGGFFSRLFRRKVTPDQMIEASRKFETYLTSK